VVKEDDILSQNVSRAALAHLIAAWSWWLTCADVEQIEERRNGNPDMDAIYLISPEAHIVDCVVHDLNRKKYRRAFLVWTSVLDPPLRRRIERAAQDKLAGFQTLSIDFFPRESHLIVFRDPWSFPILYNPECSPLVASHLETLAQKVCSCGRPTEAEVADPPDHWSMRVLG
jgi:hypothetical protein